MVTYGSCTDCKEATHLIKNIDAKLVQIALTVQTIFHIILINKI